LLGIFLASLRDVQRCFLPGWWLGASIVAIVHVASFIGRSLLARLFSRKRAAPKEASKCAVIEAIRKYLSVTMFHGFPFLARETNVIAALPWLLLLPGCIALAFQQSAVLINTYNDEPV